MELSAKSKQAHSHSLQKFLCSSQILKLEKFEFKLSGGEALTGHHWVNQLRDRKSSVRIDKEVVEQIISVGSDG